MTRHASITVVCITIYLIFHHSFSFFMFRDIRLLRDSPAVSRYLCLEVQKAVDNVVIRWKVDLNGFQLVFQINPKEQKEKISMLSPCFAIFFHIP